MAEPRIQLLYHTSFTGRLTFFVFLCASLACVTFIAVPLALLALQTGGHAGWGMGIAALLLAFGGAACSMMSGLRAFGTGLRLTTTNEGFKYDGLFRVLRVRWNRIESFELTEGDFIVRLKVKTRSESRGTQTLSLDVGGLSPDKDEILLVFSEATGLPLPPPKKKKKGKKAQDDTEAKEQPA